MPPRSTGERCWGETQFHCDSSTPDKLFVVGQAVWRRSLLAFGLMLAWFFGRYLIIVIANT